MNYLELIGKTVVSVEEREVWSSDLLKELVITFDDDTQIVVIVNK
jgi:hypothetical protein